MDSKNELLVTIMSSLSQEESRSISENVAWGKHDFIEGYKLLSMGSMSAIRNIFSHSDEERRTPKECFEMLLFLNWMLRFYNPNNIE